MMAGDQALTKRINLDPYNSIVFDAAHGAAIYLVGGFTRDLLVNRVSIDRDYVVGGPMEKLVEEVVRLTGGKLVRLGEEGLMRVVLKDGGTMDFTALAKAGIEEDLSRRDFTINAIAWSPEKGWIDPAGGTDDLKHKLVRTIHVQNLRRDPIRILRAYRFAGELSFAIETKTRSDLRRSARLIANTSGERITLEFFKILNLKNPSDTVSMILKDDLLTNLINRDNSELQRRVKALSHLFLRSSEFNLKYRINGEQIFSQGLKRSGLLALAILLQDTPDHRFTLSSKIKRTLARLAKGSVLLEGCKDPGNLFREDLFDIFETTGEAISELLILKDLPRYVEDLQDYKTIQEKSLLSPGQVCLAIKVQTGPRIGRALRDLRRAQFAGDIRTVEEALSFLRSSFSEGTRIEKGDHPR